MNTPVYDVEITTKSDDAAVALRAAVADSLEHRLSAMDHVKAALAADPECVMALAMRAGMMLQIGTNQVFPKIAETLAEAKGFAKNATMREQAHVTALEHWLAGNLSRAGSVWRQIIDECPHDILALRLHHNASFWTGDRDELCAGPMQVLAAIGLETPGSPFVMGMCAFGLEECGDYEKAEHYGRTAVESNEDDIWALHAVAHVLEMQCRHDEGRDLLNQPIGTWSDRNPFKDHLWWHSALFSLEDGDTERVLELYDREVRVDETGFYLDVQNAASLLQRLELVGTDVGQRWEELADLAEARTGDHVMPFTDSHFMMALVGAKRLEAAQGYVASLRNFANSEGNHVADVTDRVNVPVCEALLAYGQEKFGQAADTLYEHKDSLPQLGASHAQRDIFWQVMIDAFVRASRNDQARTLLQARHDERPGSEWAQRRLEQLPI